MLTYEVLVKNSTSYHLCDFISLLVFVKFVQIIFSYMWLDTIKASKGLGLI